MKHLWVLLLFLLGVSFTAVWVADNPGEVVIYWFGWRIDTSVAFLIGVGAVAMWLLIILYTFARDLARAPRRYQERQQLKHYQQGLAQLTYSVAALAASDVITAEKHAHKAQRLLGTTPMGLLVTAQIAKSRGQEEMARELLNQMLAHKETKQIATRLLTGNNETPSSSKVYVWGKKLGSFIRKA